MINNKETILMKFNGKDVPVSADPKEREKFILSYKKQSAQEQRERIFQDIKTNGPSSIEEAESNILTLLALKTNTLNDETFFKAKLLLLKSLYIVLCTKYNIPLNKVTYKSVLSKNDPCLCPPERPAVCHHLAHMPASALNSDHSTIIGYIIMNQNHLMKLNFASTIFSFCHEFRHILQTTECSKTEFDNKFYYFNSQKPNYFLWAASPGETEADSFAYKELLYFLSEAAKEHKNVSFVNATQQIRERYVKSSISHQLLKLAYAPVLFFSKLKRKLTLAQIEKSMQVDSKSTTTPNDDNEDGSEKQ